MKIVLEAADLKEILADKYDIKKLTIVAYTIIIEGKPKEKKLSAASQSMEEIKEAMDGFTIPQPTVYPIAIPGSTPNPGFVPPVTPYGNTTTTTYTYTNGGK